MVVCSVRFISLKSCLVNLPETLANTLLDNHVLAQNVIARVTVSGQQVAAGWTGHTASGKNVVELDPAFARNLGIIEGAQVAVDISLDSAIADVVWVEPRTADDWELMELHASFLELNLLSQIRAVSVATPLTIYLNANTTVTVQIKKVEPESAAKESFAMLAPNAEVVVSPKSRTTAAANPAKRPVSVTSTRSHGVHVRKHRSKFLRSIADHTLEATLQGLSVLLPASVMRSELGVATFLEAAVILPPSPQVKDSDPALGSLSSAKEASDHTPIMPAKSLVLRAIGSETLPDGHLVFSPQAKASLAALVGSRVCLTPAAKAKVSIDALTCHSCIKPFADQEIVVGGTSQQKFLEHCRVALESYQGQPITHGQAVGDFLVGLPGNTGWTLLPSLAQLKLLKGPDAPVVHTEGQTKALVQVQGMETILGKAIRAGKRSNGMHLHGSRGSGKSVISQACAQALEKHGIHIVQAGCSQLSEERLPTIKETVHQWCMTAAWYEPSVIVLDDLDRLCPAEVEHADSTRAHQIAEVLLSVVRHFQSRHQIGLLATSQSVEALHSLLTTGHIFDDSISLKAPDKRSRQSIARAMLGKEEGQIVDWLKVANITEGYLAGDLRTLTERAKLQALVREMHNDTVMGTKGQLQTTDYLDAIKDFTPASLRGIKLQKSTVEWQDIGGLTETRQILMETLEWPTRYAPIFASCPLRLRSGLLLYGYPGCGKTLLASAVASECGLNFISVKGPEILNKYIGASEKSVRDLFDRAQAAKPCVLFFDEFDSIAPKRGHDSTGVTDRVVNQMLTQMDGAEGLDGVYVLAATSRPDLIDPALLRPGRLDKSLLCDMPGEADRISILGALARKLHMHSSVDQHWLAHETEGYSGADLQAVLYNAHLEAIHDVIAQREAEAAADLAAEPSLMRSKDVLEFARFKLKQKEDGSHHEHQTLAQKAAAVSRIETILANAGTGTARDGPVTTTSGGAYTVSIKKEHLQKSLQTTRPSIAKAERSRLDRIYHEFVDGRSADGLRDGSASSEIGKRSTLG